MRCAAGLRFIEASAQEGIDPAAIVADFLATIALFGFHSSACGAWTGIGKARRSRFFFVSWPQDWLAFYEEGDFAADDLLLVEARRRIEGFFWSEAVARAKLTPRQKKLYDAGQAYGWKDVFAVPIHGPGSLQGMVTCASMQDLDLSVSERAVLQVMATTVFERCRTSAGFGVTNDVRTVLSPREIECLQWVAIGKSDQDIAQILGISPTTAHFHVEGAKTKLAVSSRTEAVAVAVLSGLI